MVSPSAFPASTFTWPTHPHSVSRPIPNREPTASHVARNVGYSDRCSCTILTARDFSSSVNFFGMICILPDRKRCGTNPRHFKNLTNLSQVGRWRYRDTWRIRSDVRSNDL